MGLFGKLFERKVCDICGEEIKLLGNRKLEDGNLCKACAEKLSPWFDDRRHSTVAQIKEQIDKRVAQFIEAMDDECEGDECEAEQDTCISCGHPVMDDEESDDEENDDMEDLMIGGGFESEDEVDEYEYMDVKDILVDILQELKGEDSDSEEEGAFETSDENPMFGGSEESDDEEDDFEADEDDDVDNMLSPQEDWASEESDDDDDSEEEYDEEDNESLADENGVEQEDVEGMLTSPEQEEDEVEIFDCLDNA